eukprot:m.307368 g.307368  ORF g.307368 m.307368 type:complete len:80 (+) comp15934_c0_seq10:982-1221(+)
MKVKPHATCCRMDSIRGVFGEVAFLSNWCCKQPPAHSLVATLQQTNKKQETNQEKTQQQTNKNDTAKQRSQRERGMFAG